MLLFIVFKFFNTPLKREGEGAEKERILKHKKYEHIGDSNIGRHNSGSTTNNNNKK